MPLHRDIHWIGRQWAVTGHGMQLIDQKQKGFFDIEASRVWDEAMIARMRGQDWVNVADFDRGIEVARKRYQDQPRAVPQPPAIISPAPPLAPTASLAAAPPIVPSAPVAEAPAPIVTPAEPPPQQPEAIAPDEPAAGKFQMRFSGIAKFVRPWRVRTKK